MGRVALHIVRLGLGITFLVIGVMIVRNPDAWGLLVKPWVLRYLPVPLHNMMVQTGWLDIIIGAFLLINVFTWLAALLAALHLLTVLVATGINSVTIRDIGLLAAVIAIFISSLPVFLKKWFPFLNK